MHTQYGLGNSGDDFVPQRTAVLGGSLGENPAPSPAPQPPGLVCSQYLARDDAARGAMPKANGGEPSWMR